MRSTPIMRAPCEIRHVDLGATIEPLVLAEGYEALLAIFWWRGLPLGQRLFDAGELPLPAAVLANLAAQECAPAVYNHLLDSQAPAPDPEELWQVVRQKAPLAALDRRLRLRACHTIDVKASVIIPTCDRPKALIRCLDSLEPSYAHIHEIIVVDNGIVDSATRDAVAAVPNAIYLREPRAGGSIARNTGAHAANGDVLVFIDDDVIAHENWLARLLIEFNNPEIACVTGLILPFELETDAQLTFEAHFGFGRGYAFITYDHSFFAEKRSKGVPVWRLGGGGNMAIRRDLFVAAGCFDERLGPGDNAAGCSEDSELWYRLLAAGRSCRYTPAAVVYHEHRRDMAALRRQLRNYMRGHVAALLIQFEKHRHWGNIYRMLVCLPCAYTRQLAARAIRRHRHSRPTLLAEITGALAGAVFYMRDRARKSSRIGHGYR
jgi:GT2 family glycosyltransferase